MAADLTENQRKPTSIGKRLVMALPLALGWTIYTAQLTPGNLLLGFVFGIAADSATGFRGDTFRLKNPLRQLYSLLAFVLYEAKVVLLAGFDVARIILSPSLPIKPGLARVSTQDSTKSELISAISAHGITVAPGELVVDFDEDADAAIMIIHCLNLDESAPQLDADQQRRLRQILGILGYD
ncbi:MAG: Na+/H+ antiporter subunit E [Chloroflexi bacterium]|nr:Na+/H+ antiporter subunit E [Chloroflexota bacterium]MCY4248147.1 Na+/H+ antiporter subunit E [Chloroflexota bacterium]